MFSNNQIDINTLPSLEELELIPIHKNFLYILIINIGTIFVGAVGGLTFARWVSEDDGFSHFAFYLQGVLVVVGLIVMLIYYLGFKNRKYAIREQDMTYTHGYLVTKIITLPYNRIQHLEIRRSFLARKFSLSTLKIYSAGESGGDLAIRGLPMDIAERQYAHLTQIINDRV